MNPGAAGTISDRVLVLLPTVRDAERSDDPEFVARLRRGDARAFEDLVRTHQHRLFGVALRMLGNAAEAEEATQEAFVRAHGALRDFRGGGRHAAGCRSRP